MTETTIGRVMESTLAFNDGLKKGARERRLAKAVLAVAARLRQEAENAEFEGRLACHDMREEARELELAYAEARPR